MQRPSNQDILQVYIETDINWIFHHLIYNPESPNSYAFRSRKKSNIYTGAILLSQSFVEFTGIDISREREHSINYSFLLHNCRFTG